MRGRTLFLALVAVFSVLSATAIAGGHRVVMGTTGGDELNAAGGADRVFARSGDDTVNGGSGNDRVRGGRGDDALFGGDGKDRLRGGQDNDLLDGGDGNDYLNGGGDGRDKDRVVCGDGYDVVVLGRNDVVLVEVEASGDHVEDDEAGDAGCEKVKGPGRGNTEACGATSDGCEPRPCASRLAPGCHEPAPCASRVAPYSDCDEPVSEEPGDDPVDEELPSDEEGEL